MNAASSNTQPLQPRPFMERLTEAITKKGGPVIVGLDPRPEWFPPDVVDHGRTVATNTGTGGDIVPGTQSVPSMTTDPRLSIAAAIVRFNELIIDAVADVAVAVKPQLAFYERWGWPGMWALQATIEMARERNLLVIADGKRNDIGSTAAAYAQTYLGDGGGEDDAGHGPGSGLEADALTINPYLGTDGIAPFLALCRDNGNGVFVLVRTSNPSGAELQSLPTEGGVVADRVADMIVRWNEHLPKANGYGPVGAVVGATHPEEARALRQRLPGVMLLVPGYGAQGAGATDARAAFDARGRGAVVNSARGILYAWREERPDDPGSGELFAAAARRAALTMRSELQAVLG